MKKILKIIDKLNEYLKYIHFRENEQDKYREIAITKIINKLYMSLIKKIPFDTIFNGLSNYMQKKIQQIISSGTFDALEDIKEYFDRPENKILKDAMKLYHIAGLGPHKAISLAEEGIYTKTQLRQKHIFDTLPLITKQELIYNPLRHIPREVISDVEKRFRKLGEEFYICGSYRRGLPYTSDLDVLVLDFDKFITLLTEPYVQGEEKISGMLRWKINNEYTYLKIDFYKTTRHDLYFGLIFLTGSQNFNIVLRKLAKTKGYKLNQYGLFNIATGRRKQINSEEELFDFLDLEYLPPEERI